MTQTNWTPENQPAGEADPLSATGMFLNALGKESNPPQKQPEERPVQPVAPAAPKSPAWSLEEMLASPPQAAPVQAAQGGPGEFTRMFQVSEQAEPEPPRPPAAPQPAVQPAAPIEAKQAPVQAPGEFTRIFVKSVEAKPAERAPAPPARVVPEPPPAAAPAPGAPRMKGFSSGASDSASVEGGFTQYFQPRPAASAAAPTPAPAPRVQSYIPPAPSPVPPVEEFKWSREPSFSAPESPTSSVPGSPSVTSLFASLASGGLPQQEVRAEPVKAQPFESVPSFSPAPTYSPAPPTEPSSLEAGSVTRLIQRLSEGGAKPAAPVEPILSAGEMASPQAGAGPSEFTKIFSTTPARPGAAPAAPPAAPPAAASPFAAPALPPLPAMPAAPKPMAPPAPPAFQAPKMEAPKAPALAAPAPPAAKSKLEEMVPILLVVNTFLLIVLIVVEIFALKAK